MGTAGLLTKKLFKQIHDGAPLFTAGYWVLDFGWWFIWTSFRHICALIRSLILITDDILSWKYETWVCVVGLRVGGVGNNIG